jgi:hypothetical protein
MKKVSLLLVSMLFFFSGYTHAARTKVVIYPIDSTLTLQNENYVILNKIGKGPIETSIIPISNAFYNQK